LSASVSLKADSNNSEMIAHTTMKTATKQHTQPKPSQQSLIHDAFVILLEHLGPEKTMQLWHLFFPPQKEYVKARQKLFAGIDVATMAEAIRKFKTNM
jgi:hypothetical protein